MEQRRLLLAIGAAAGGLAAAAVVPIALAHADDGVSDDGFTLVSGGPHVPYTALGPNGYAGFQPLFTEWQQYQPTDVEIGGTTVGSYDVFETDYASPWVMSRSTTSAQPLAVVPTPVAWPVRR